MNTKQWPDDQHRNADRHLDQVLQFQAKIMPVNYNHVWGCKCTILIWKNDTAKHAMTVESVSRIAEPVQQQQRPFNGLWSGTTRVGRYQKELSPTHTYPNQRASFIIFLHLQNR